MNTAAKRVRFVATCLVLLSGVTMAQTAKSVAAQGPSAAGAIAMASRGECKQALPALNRMLPHVSDKQLRYRGWMASVRCAMSLNDETSAVSGLMQLKREFPQDPEVLYISTHYYSQLAMRSSKQLVAAAPDSPQARQLEAEAYESQGKWDEAIAVYRKILDGDSNSRGVHYRLAQALLAKPDASAHVSEAKTEFERELAIDPGNASAEFMLGELARRSEQWDDAITHFTKASKLDVGFAEAYLALGMSLAGAARFKDAAKPLQTYTEMVPDDPAGHYQLAVIYARTGDKEGAAREMELHRKLAQSANVR